MKLVSTQKFGINIVFSWDDCNTHEKLETMDMKNLGGRQGALWSMWKWWFEKYITQYKTD